jgi:hypothetical protein
MSGGGLHDYFVWLLSMVEAHAYPPDLRLQVDAGSLAGMEVSQAVALRGPGVLAL